MSSSLLQLNESPMQQHLFSLSEDPKKLCPCPYYEGLEGVFQKLLSPTGPTQWAGDKGASPSAGVIGSVSTPCHSASNAFGDYLSYNRALGNT
jgi:hypothetical protein